MNEGQRAKWKQALAVKAAAARTQRYQPRKTLLSVRGAGMVRIPAPQQQRTERIAP